MLIDTLHHNVDALARLAPFRALSLRQARQAFVANRDQNLFFGIHASWDEAVSAAQGFGVAGYTKPLSVPLSLALARADWYQWRPSITRTTGVHS